MNLHLTNTAEEQAAKAFGKQSNVFDQQYGNDAIIQYKRKRVRDHVLKFLKPQSDILELNAGTGEDAIYFASLGHHVHATDISSGMLEQLTKKIDGRGLHQSITSEQCSFTELDALQNKGPYDLIFSNFAGLNCTNQLDKVFTRFDKLLKAGGIVVMVMLPGFCLWETLLVFKGKFRTAFRRFFSSNGRKAKVEGMPFTCWYHSPKRIKKILSDKFTLLDLEGLCTIVPPSYIEHFAERYPKLFSLLGRNEEKYARHWPWNRIGDYYIISFRKK